MRLRSRLLITVGAFSCLSTFVSESRAVEPFPNRPIHLIVPFAPGGGADTNARKIAEPWARSLGKPIVVENRPGAGGTLGASYVAHAGPDGYTLLYATPGQQMTAPYLFKNLSYDPFKDLISVGKLTEGANVLVVTKSLPVKTVQELIDYAKAHPGTLGFASSGVGSTSHLAGELFKKEAGVDIFHVPYRGSGPARNDLIGGQVPMTIDTLSVYLPQIEAGDVRALGVSTLKRNASKPDIPTIAETLPRFEAFPINYIAAPAGTSPAIIEKLNTTLNRVMEDPQVKQSFMMGTDLTGSTPQEMDGLVKSEQAKWKDLIESTNITVD